MADIMSIEGPLKMKGFSQIFLSERLSVAAYQATTTSSR